MLVSQPCRFGKDRLNLTLRIGATLMEILFECAEHVGRWFNSEGTSWDYVWNLC
jgi:hypothetical protein